VIQDDHIEVRREAGKLDALRDLLYSQPLTGPIGMGHTAGHHMASESDERPPASRCTGDLVVITTVSSRTSRTCAPSFKRRATLSAAETDTETIVHLVEQYVRDGLSFEERAPDPQSLAGITGGGAENRCQPDRLITHASQCWRCDDRLGDGNVSASDMPAILDYTRKVVFLESRQMAIVPEGWLSDSVAGR